MVDTVICAKTKIFLTLAAWHEQCSWICALCVRRSSLFFSSFQILAFLANVEESMYGTNVA